MKVFDPLGQPVSNASGSESGVIRLVAVRGPWPSPQTRPNREGLRLTWDVIDALGERLVENTEHPLSDGAFVLLEQGVPPETRITMCHAGAPYDSFLPIEIGIAAGPAIKRAENSARLAQWRDRLRKRSVVPSAGGDGIDALTFGAALPNTEGERA